MARIEIKNSENGVSLIDVFIDGHKVNGIRSITFHAEPAQLPIVEIDFNALDISINSPVLLFDKTSMGEMEITFKHNGPSGESPRADDQ